MSILLYKKFINELMDQGVKIENLTLKELSESIKLYKKIAIK